VQQNESRCSGHVTEGECGRAGPPRIRRRRRQIGSIRSVNSHCAISQGRDVSASCQSLNPQPKVRRLWLTGGKRPGNLCRIRQRPARKQRAIDDLRRKNISKYNDLRI
jgi:hypothetical protein